MKKFHFEILCIEAKGTDIEEMVDQSRIITYRTFFSHVSLDEVVSLFPDIYTKHGNLYQNYLNIKRDGGVSYFKSRYQNRRCYYLTWSAIEFVFTEKRPTHRLKGLYVQSRDLSSNQSEFKRRITCNT